MGTSGRGSKYRCIFLFPTPGLPFFFYLFIFIFISFYFIFFFGLPPGSTGEAGLLIMSVSYFRKLHWIHSILTLPYSLSTGNSLSVVLGLLI